MEKKEFTLEDFATFILLVLPAVLCIITIVVTDNMYQWVPREESAAPLIIAYPLLSAFLYCAWILFAFCAVPLFIALISAVSTVICWFFTMLFQCLLFMCCAPFNHNLYKARVERRKRLLQEMGCDVDASAAATVSNEEWEEARKAFTN